MNKKISHDALVLFAFTVVLGLLLGIVYEITKGPIAKINFEKLQTAYRQVFQSASSFVPYDDFDVEEANSYIEKLGFEDSIDDVQIALDSKGKSLGMVIVVTAKDASQAAITFSVGIQMDGTVNGYSITSIAETPGMGMKVGEEKFYSQFEGKNVDSFILVKTSPIAENEIEAISGSTVSSRAITNGVNACIAYFKYVTIPTLALSAQK